MSSWCFYWNDEVLDDIWVNYSSDNGIGGYYISFIKVVAMTNCETTLNTYKAANATLHATLQRCREENKKLKEENKRLKERYPIRNEYKVF